MKFLKYFLLVGTIFCLIFFLSCAGGKQVSKQSATSLQLLPEQSPATKSGVTITVIPISDKDPKYTFGYPVVKQSIFGPETVTKQACIFGEGACAFKVEIQNNTDHVIRLANAVVQLTGASGRSIDPMSATFINQSWQTFGVAAPPATNYGLFDIESARILPGKSIEGVFAFDTQMKGIGSGTLVIYDIVTKVDAAGNPTERSNFDFNFKEVTSEFVR